MGFFSAITGVDSRKEAYLKTIHHCMRRLNTRADELGINLKSYYNTFNSSSFQEKSIMFFLANAAAVDYSEKENMLYLRGIHLDALSDVVLQFLKDNGIMGMNFKSYIYDIETNHEYLKLFSQGLFGRDFVFAEKYNKHSPNDVLSKFLKLLVEERAYSEEMDDKNPVYKETLVDSTINSVPANPLKEKDESLKVLEYTAGIGVSESQFLLAQAHYTGSFGLDVDFNEALYWAEKSAEQGYAKGQLFSALRYLAAEGAERDEYSAKYWLQKAIDNKDDAVKDEAEHILSQVKQFENLDPKFLK